jgi:hypothetical protein
MGMMQMLMATAGSGVVSALPGGTANGAAGVAATLTVNTNGTLTLTLPAVSQNWYLPTTAGIGAGYYVNFTLDSGDAFDYDTTSGSWTQLNNFDQYVGYATGAGAKSSSVIVEISTSGSGTPVVSSGTYTLQYTG